MAVSVRGLFIAAGGLILAGGMLAGAFEFASWLINGYWPYLTLADAFGNWAAPDWTSITPTILWLWTQPLWAVTACIGAALLVLGAAIPANK